MKYGILKFSIVGLLLVFFVWIFAIMKVNYANPGYLVEGTYCTLESSNGPSECRKIAFPAETLKNMMFPACPSFIFLENPAFHLKEGSCELTKIWG